MCAGSYYFICMAWTGIKFEGLGGGRQKRGYAKCFQPLLFMMWKDGHAAA